MKSHELANLLLSKPDANIFHHFYFHEDFRDDGFDHINNVELKEDGGNLFISDKEGYHESLTIFDSEMKELLAGRR